VVLVAATAIVAGAAITGAAAFRNHREWVVAEAEQARRTRLAGARGGVFDLTEPIGERWTVAFAGLERPQPLAVLPGGAVVFSERTFDLVYEWFEPLEQYRYIPRNVRTHLIALGAQTGAEAWRLELPGWADCGESFPWPIIGGSPRLPHLENMVCITQNEDSQLVTVVDAAGTVETRFLPGDDARVTVGPDGLLWRIAAASFEQEWFIGSFSLLGLFHLMEVGQFEPMMFDLLAIVEDPLSGEELWQSAFQIEHDGFSWSCWFFDGFETETRAYLTIDDFSLRPVGDAFVVYEQCSNYYTLLSLSGEVIAERIDRWNEVNNWRRLVDDGFARTIRGEFGTHSWPVAAELFDASVGYVKTVDGRLLDPLTTDGAGGLNLRGASSDRDEGGLIFTATPTEIAAWTLAGEEVWRTSEVAQVRRAVARTEDVLVLATGTGEWRYLQAVDRDTGDLLWSIAAAEMPSIRYIGATHEPWAWTDGRVLLVATDGQMFGRIRSYGPALDGHTYWTAFYLETGEVLWERESAWPLGSIDCLTADGALLCVIEEAVTRIG